MNCSLYDKNEPKMVLSKDPVLEEPSRIEELGEVMELEESGK
jgi:hypothetical protein